jgi:O-antigen ligase
MMNRADNTFFLFNPFYAFIFLAVLALSVALLATPYYTYAVIPAAAIFFIMCIGHYPKFGFYLIVFMIPFGEYGGLTKAYKYLTISKFVGVLLVVLIAVQMVLSRWGRFSIKSKLWLPLALLMSVSLVSTLLSDYPATSADNLRRLFMAYVFVFLALVFVTEEGFKKTYPAVLTASMVISAVLAVAGYVFNISLFAVNIDTGSIKRATGGTVDPNIFSALLIFALPFLVHRFLHPKKGTDKALMLASIAATVAAIVLTFSRGGALVLAITLVLLFVEHVRRLRPNHMGFYTLTAMVILLAMLFVMPASYWERQKSVTDTSSRSIGRRISYLFVGWEAVKANPVVGSGPGTFMEHYAQTGYAMSFLQKEDTVRRHAHNTYLEVLTGTGALGLLFYLAACVLSFKNFLSARRKFSRLGDKEMASLSGAYLMAFVSLLIYLLIVSITYHKFFWISLALSQVALNAATAAEERKESEKEPGKEPGKEPNDAAVVN